MMEAGMKILKMLLVVFVLYIVPLKFLALLFGTIFIVLVLMWAVSFILDGE